MILVLVSPLVAFGQAEPVRTVSVSVGKSAIVESPVPLRRISIAQSSIAEAIAVSRTEVLVNGVANGSTSLIVWGTDGSRRFYSVEVTPDAQGLQEHLSNLFPADSIRVTASKDALILSGSVSEGSVAARARTLAEAAGVPVVDNISVPSPRQILLQVRMAEVSRTAMRELSANFVRIDPFDLRGDDEGFIGTNRNTPPAGNLLNSPAGPDQTFSDAVNFYLFNPDEQIAAFIRALRTRGLFRSLAEPNLLALDG
ncbi:MAG: pilus assembly protein N-terminal domain-containing protein, partial [Halobacteriales archaeon]|nr:pilus assembly protein N-terminal domain-containing protein [Halobacteriales archaeon]